MQNKILPFMVLLLFLSSCQAQDTDILLIDQLDKTFSVAKFYQSRLQKTDEILSTDPKKLDKKTALKALETAMFEKDTLAFYSSEGRLPSDFYLESTNDWMSRKKKPVKYFGYQYKTVVYDEAKDTLAILNKVVFPSLDMAENNKGEFAYLRASKASRNKNDFSDLLSFLQKNSKRIPIGDSLSEEVSCWENKNFYYILSKKEGKEEEILSYDHSGNKNSKMIDISNIRLAIYSKEYIQTLKKEKAYVPEYIPVFK